MAAIFIPVRILLAKLFRLTRINNLPFKYFQEIRYKP